jgi:hypothetical protein
MIIDNCATSPGNLNPRHRPEHIDQRPRHHASFAVTLRKGRPAPSEVNQRLIALPGVTGFGATSPLAREMAKDRFPPN